MFEGLSQGKTSWIERVALRKGWSMMPKGLKRWVPLVSGAVLAAVAILKGASVAFPELLPAVTVLDTLAGVLSLGGNVDPEVVPGIAGLGVAAGVFAKLYATSRKPKDEPKP